MCHAASNALHLPSCLPSYPPHPISPPVSRNISQSYYSHHLPKPLSPYAERLCHADANPPPFSTLTPSATRYADPSHSKDRAFFFMPSCYTPSLSFPCISCTLISDWESVASYTPSSPTIFKLQLRLQGDGSGTSLCE
jgi:hypothetical protein